MVKLTRGMRNNNPFNIRKSNNNWYGKVPGKDKEFETFDTLEHGYRAGLILLSNYYRKYKLHSYGAILRRFAPPKENNLKNYLKWIQKYTDIYPDSYIELKVLLYDIAPLIAYYESRFYDVELMDSVSDKLIKLYKEYE